MSSSSSSKPCIISRQRSPCAAHQKQIVDWQCNYYLWICTFTYRSFWHFSQKSVCFFAIIIVPTHSHFIKFSRGLHPRAPQILKEISPAIPKVPIRWLNYQGNSLTTLPLPEKIPIFKGGFEIFLIFTICSLDLCLLFMAVKLVIAG